MSPPSLPLRLRLILDGVQGPNSYNQFGLFWSKTEFLSWALPQTLPCILVLQIMSPPLRSFFVFEEIDFPSKMVPCRFSVNLPSFGLGTSSKGQGFILWLPTNRIVLFQYWTLD
jgi:hypothetical protein